MTTVQFIVKTILVLASLAAALCWYRAATAKAPPVQAAPAWISGALPEKDGRQMIADVELQSRWNSFAALFATAAAIAQIVEALLSSH